jgi:hypothetical protein
MSNYLFHQSYLSDLAAFDADTYVDPFDAMVDEAAEDITDNDQFFADLEFYLPELAEGEDFGMEFDACSW